MPAPRRGLHREAVRLVHQRVARSQVKGPDIGRPGTGANSITGQCNAMGSRLFSNTTNLLGGRAFRGGLFSVQDVLQAQKTKAAA